MNSKYYDIAFAVHETGAFGNQGGLPWPRLPNDMERFKALSDNYDIIMCGKNTFDSLPRSYKEVKHFIVLCSSNLPASTDIDINYVKLDQSGERNLIDLLPKWAENALFIGGAYLINNRANILADARNIYVSAIYSDTPVDADVFVDQQVNDILQYARFSRIEHPKAKEIDGFYSETRVFW